MRIRTYFAIAGVASLIAMNLAMAAALTCTSFVGGSLHYPCQIVKSNYYIGRGDEWPGAPDFYMNLEDRSTNDPGNMLQGGTPKLFTRSIFVADKGDAPEIGIRMAGPDNSNYNDWNASGVKDGQNLGTIYWQTYGGKVGGGFGWWPGNGHNGRAVSMYPRACGDQTATNRAGQWFLATSQNGNPGDPVVRLRVDCSGRLLINFGGSMRVVSRRSDGVLTAN